MPAVDLPSDAPTIRLCHLVRWPDFDGYGFNLYTEKSRNGQYLGDIDSGSPAEAAGLRKGDRIVEVNGVNVNNENHRQVVERIKSVQNETRLLVVDEEADKWYKEHKVTIKGTLPTVKVLKSIRPGINGDSNGRRDSMTSTEGPAPRLCRMRKWPDFQGYGFNLHADKNRQTQYIGVVDVGSPAELAGLKQNDTIVEVNGENVQKCKHHEIVDKIKANPNECTLLVVEEQTAKWYKNKGVIISSSLPNVVRMETPVNNPATQAAVPPRESPTPKPVPPPQVPNGDLDGTKQMVIHVPRLCHLVKWPDFDGYGFNLHADKARNLHFIGDVDEGSPAHLGGLRKGDRLVEVNGLNIENVSHQQIIEQIKSNPEATDLLVVDEKTDQLYHDRGQTPRGDAPEVEHSYTPRNRSAESPEGDVCSKTSSSPGSSRSATALSPQPPISPATTVDEYEVNASCSSPSSMDGGAPPPNYAEANNGHNNNGTSMGDSSNALFTLKASEMREMLKNRKKKDPRGTQMDLMQKYKIIEQM